MNHIDEEARNKTAQFNDFKTQMSWRLTFFHSDSDSMVHIPCKATWQRRTPLTWQDRATGVTKRARACAQSVQSAQAET